MAEILDTGATDQMHNIRKVPLIWLIIRSNDCLTLCVPGRFDVSLPGVAFWWVSIIVFDNSSISFSVDSSNWVYSYRLLGS
ncbi:hypothetical protein XENTR_v10007741 [Xenopus tropicalis]|nr:hypothetical protein XENTR_v10007741 [Xenopus tropicalis]